MSESALVKYNLPVVYVQLVVMDPNSVKTEGSQCMHWRWNIIIVQRTWPLLAQYLFDTSCC